MQELAFDRKRNISFIRTGRTDERMNPNAKRFCREKMTDSDCFHIFLKYESSSYLFKNIFISSFSSYYSQFFVVVVVITPLPSTVPFPLLFFLTFNLWNNS